MTAIYLKYSGWRPFFGLWHDASGLLKMWQEAREIQYARDKQGREGWRNGVKNVERVG
jgi:hypothetical protein